ncbi:MAG: hypothetical protein J1F63_08310 [Oscillospiraceae bacterium]|nr:hypothetical protein [Oscillospiraceae bacterium]
MSPTTIGIPRGMLYYRYEALWRTFFSELGANIVVSEPTTHRIAEEGMSVTIDEACLSVKVFFGHVNNLLGRCDYIFVPRISSFGRNRELCPRFTAMYDVAKNMFRNSGQKFLTCNVDVPAGDNEKKAFLSLGQALGCSAKSTIKAYKKAKKEEQRAYSDKLQKQKRLLEQDGLKILIAGHDYLVEDAYIGKPITDFLKKNGAVPLSAGIADRDAALNRSTEMSPTCKWQLNREIIGGIAMYRDKIDGIIFLSAFPCGPDAMVNELVLRRVDCLPMLNLVLDGQNGTAGTETRLESFLDIIRFKRGLL